MPNPKQPPSPLDDFLSRLLDEVFIPRADDIAESVSHWFDRMIREAERRAMGQLPPGQDRPKKGKKAQPKGKATKTPQTTPKRPLKTAYDVLGVSPKAPQEVLQAAYKALARMYHPDVAPKGEWYKGGKSKWLDIMKAWECVKDPGRRAKYDRETGL